MIETSDSSTQTSSVKSISRFQHKQELKRQEEFNSYNCFYCALPINSEQFLLDHFKNCRIKGDHPRIQEQISDEKRLEPNEWNAIKTMLLSLKSPRVPSDVCHQEFESEGFVNLHKMSDHGR